MKIIPDLGRQKPFASYSNFSPRGGINSCWETLRGSFAFWLTNKLNKAKLAGVLAKKAEIKLQNLFCCDVNSCLCCFSLAWIKLLVILLQTSYTSNYNLKHNLVSQDLCNISFTRLKHCEVCTNSAFLVRP